MTAKTDALSSRRLDVRTLEDRRVFDGTMDQSQSAKPTDILGFVKDLFRAALLFGVDDLYLQFQQKGGVIRFQKAGVTTEHIINIPPKEYACICRCICLLGKAEPARMRRETVEAVIPITLDRDVDLLFVSGPSKPLPSIALRFKKIEKH